jgi:hypothetical protein
MTYIANDVDGNKASAASETGTSQTPCGNVVENVLAAIAKLPIPPTAKYIGTIMVTLRLIDSKSLSEFTGIPLRTVQRAMTQVSASGVIGAMSATSGAPVAPSAPPVASERVSRVHAHAQMELPSEVLPTKEVKKDTPPPPKGPSRTICLEAFEAYNATALRCGLPQAARMTPDRERRIAARLKDYGIEGWQRALANIEKSSFLTGTNDRGWRASLDFLLQAESFGKVHDGGYGNGRHAAQKLAPVRKVYDQHAQAAAFQAAAAQMLLEDGVVI